MDVRFRGIAALSSDHGLRRRLRCHGRAMRRQTTKRLTTYLRNFEPLKSG